MKKLILFIAVLSLFSTFSLAQDIPGRPKKEVVSESLTSGPTFAFVFEYTDAENVSVSIPLQVTDRLFQSADFKMKRMQQQLQGRDPIRPNVKLIFYEELGGLNFRLAETLEELKRPVDNEKVLLVDYLELLEAMRTKYN